MERLDNYTFDRDKCGASASFFYTLNENLLNVTLAVLLLFLLSPLLLITSLVVFLFTGYPVLYKQERVGQNGISFIIYKFRTMYNDSGSSTVTKINDERVTRVGRFLRKYYIDELPQLFNVLKRDMNLIGPRPERPCFVGVLRKIIKEYDDRHSIKPGITGWQQVNISYGFEDPIKKQKLDIYYIENSSPMLDAKILLLTITTILSGKGRY